VMSCIDNSQGKLESKEDGMEEGERFSDSPGDKISLSVVLIIP
jgi:hypothetical protein